MFKLPIDPCLVNTWKIFRMCRQLDQIKNAEKSIRRHPWLHCKLSLNSQHTSVKIFQSKMLVKRNWKNVTKSVTAIQTSGESRRNISRMKQFKFTFFVCKFPATVALLDLGRRSFYKENLIQQSLLVLMCHNCSLHCRVGGWSEVFPLLCGFEENGKIK